MGINGIKLVKHHLFEFGHPRLDTSRHFRDLKKADVSQLGFDHRQAGPAPLGALAACAMGNFCLDATVGMSRKWVVWPILWAILEEKVDEDDDRPADLDFTF